ncbi:Rha family transcriptional regulator [Halomonas sp. SH5A2]|uniref:Rha family transcriptional regulator n=1 Tax=Halomonas sp. SH5A2 TaxID=2749040 RepID=UPI0016406C89|nr:Rha family transcriptional regulator [Halomonas sp. SH5A2]
MSSREIAEVVLKRHDNVRRTIDMLLVHGTVTVTQTEEPTPGGGKPVTVYHVNQRDSYVIVAQLSPEFTACLVDRWQELEKQAAQPQVPQSFAEALRLVADTQPVLWLNRSGFILSADVRFIGPTRTTVGTRLAGPVRIVLGLHRR